MTITKEHLAEPDSIRALISKANVAQPGDVVILKYPTLLKAQQVEELRRGLDHVKDRGIKFLVFGGDVEITIARKTDEAKA